MTPGSALSVCENARITFDCRISIPGLVVPYASALKSLLTNVAAALLDKHHLDECTDPDSKSQVVSATPQSSELMPDKTKFCQSPLQCSCCALESCVC